MVWLKAEWITEPPISNGWTRSLYKHKQLVSRTPPQYYDTSGPLIGPLSLNSQRWLAEPREIPAGDWSESVSRISPGGDMMNPVWFHWLYRAPFCRVETGCSLGFLEQFYTGGLLVYREGDLNFSLDWYNPPPFILNT